MRAARAVLMAVGVGFGLWGLWLVRDFAPDQLVSTALFLAGGVIVHDAVLAPVTVLLGVGAARLLPGHARAVAAVGFIVWATLTVAVANVLLGQGGKAGNETILGRPYVLTWLAVTALVATAVAVATRRRRPADAVSAVPDDA